MQETKFPLLCGHLSIDLVNTEVVRRGQRLDLLPSESEINNWLYFVQAQIPFWTDFHVDFEPQLPAIKNSLIVSNTQIFLLISQNSYSTFFDKDNRHDS